MLPYGISTPGRITRRFSTVAWAVAREVSGRIPVSSTSTSTSTSTVRGSGEILLWEVVRVVAGFPLDIASDAGLLVESDGVAGEEGFRGGSEIGTGDRHVVPRSAASNCPL